MEKLKGLIIENDRSIPIELEAFQKDQADMFSEIRVISHARFYPEDIKEALREGFNAIIGLSTFMYKDQLESTVLALEASPIDYTFFFHGTVYHLNEFIETVCDRPRQSYQFEDFEKFIQIIKKWVNSGKVFSIEKDYEAKPIIDKLHDFRNKIGQECERQPLMVVQVLYNEEYNVFYLNNADSDIEYIKSKNKEIHKNY